MGRAVLNIQHKVIKLCTIIVSCIRAYQYFRFVCNTL